MSSCSVSDAQREFRWDQLDWQRVRRYGQHQLFTWLQGRRSNFGRCSLHQHWTLVTQRFLSTYVNSVLPWRCCKVTECRGRHKEDFPKLSMVQPPNRTARYCAFESGSFRRLECIWSNMQILAERYADQDAFIMI